ncbi:actin-related protein 10 [Pieris brassicae]|uniref:actin-related protein 10 n=1 Tax=Pieris brassicae TaxID=7116 RepID=UPI001E65E996|nr:actin-related protein 10 [Pieris brassicae]
MTLYEGIALIQEKQAVVLDLGADYTKFGFTGEAAPRCIIKSEFWCPMERRYKQVYDYNTTEELYDNLVQMLHLLYFRHVLVNPKERKVVVIESLLTTTQFRETLAKVLYMHYEVSGVTWWDTGRACAATLGVGTALVVSIGAREAEVTPVVHAAPLVHAIQVPPLGMQAVRVHLANILKEDNETELQLDDNVLEDILVRTCFVPSRTLAIQLASEGCNGVRSVVCGGAGTSVRVTGRARALAAEPLFERDRDMASLPDAVLQCLIQCPRDTRRVLAENILITGGGATLPGLKARIAHELRHLITVEPYKDQLHIKTFKFHSSPCEDNVCAWVGGAVCGGADGGGRAEPRDVYLRTQRLRDWACLLHNTPPDHHHRCP